jgi:hypothetical protein
VKEKRVPWKASWLSEEAREFFRQQGSVGGKLGAKARMEKLTPEQRSEIARNAVRAREAKRAQQRKGQRKK